MIRGTTAQFRYALPYNFDDLDEATVTFWQPGNGGLAFEGSLPIIKTTLNGVTHLPDNKYVVYVTLTREETLRFITERKAKTQLKGKTKSGIDFASREKYITVYPIADGSDTDDPTLPSNNGFVLLDGGRVVAKDEAVIL